MKTLYLVRHGLAEEADVFAARPDAERRLTAKGRKKADQAAKGLGRMKCAPDRIVSSPLVRAEETAAILARRLAPRGRRELSDRLSPRASVSGLIRWLARQRGNSILLVGHMPMLGELASVLLGGGGRAVIQLKKSGACCFTFSGAIRPGRATLAWLMPPAGLSRV